jgi:hypothetical protein
MAAEDERWHVRIAPDEVKLLTLEQVDDLFRLDMIDENTLLRQEGSSEWLPLRVVAGLDEDEPASIAAVPSAPPPPPPPLPAPSERAPFVHSPSFAPPPVSARVPNALPKPPSPSFTPPPSVAPPAPRVAPPAPSVAPPPRSFAPPALSFTPPQVALAQPTRASRGEVWLIGLAALLGLLVTLQRNGALAALLASAGQAAGYAKLEASLGGPGFGTVRAVDALVAKTPADQPR